MNELDKAIDRFIGGMIITVMILLSLALVK